MATFSEDDIRQELLEMGYTPSRKLIGDLRKAITKADENRTTDENYASTHPFSGLDVDSRQVREDAGRGVAEIETPLVIRSTAGGRKPLRWNPIIPDAIDTITFECPELDGLMERAYASVGRTYELVDQMEDMKTELEELNVKDIMEYADREARRAISDDSTPSTEQSEKEEEEGAKKMTMYEESKEKGTRIKDRRMGGGGAGGGGKPSLFSGAASERSEGGKAVVEGVETLPGAVGLEGGVRPVLAPPPGRRPFRFDPVNRIGIYQQEWKRLPAPGEKKRLSLRWKIREQLLQRDIPHFDRRSADQPAARLAVPPLNHEKDWSPRPYID